ncbi:MAG: peptidase, partial [Chlamydiae bacterium]|nr:peptidase [Chlamydiota bacterium]
LAGPLVNIAFAFIAFTLLWACGGREKPFAYYTHLIGWVEADSGLYKEGVRPGDKILSYGGQPFQGFMPLQSMVFLDKGAPLLQGEEIQYMEGISKPFSYRFPVSREAKGQEKWFAVLSTVSPAGYLIYRPDFVTTTVSPLQESGIQPGDRVVWVDGELVFSRRQLSAVVNQARTLLTVQRGNEIFLTRVPRIQIEELRVNSAEKAEFHDWAYARKLKQEVSSLFFLPYEVSHQAIVKSSTAYIDEKAVEQKAFMPSSSSIEIPLQPGDRIVAVDGKTVSSGEEVLEALQTRHIQVVVQRGMTYPPVSWKHADVDFLQGISWEDLKTLTKSIGARDRLSCQGSLCLLAPVEPKPLSAFVFTESVQEKLESDLAAQEKQIQEIQNRKERQEAMRALEMEQQRLLLGGVFEDRKVAYNPYPWDLFLGAFSEMKKTLSALFSGYLSPKHMMGPVGIVGVMQQGWGIGVKEALFWMAMISLNLGLVNLLPIPVLDGGHICFALYEAVTKRPIKAKTMERLIIPFIVLIIAFFLYATYHDVLRFFSS